MVCSPTHFLVCRAILLLDVIILDALSALMTPSSLVVLAYYEILCES